MLRDAPAIVVLAAGASTRMRGEDKLMRQVDGEPLLSRAVRAACAASPRVVVTLPPVSLRLACLAGTPATPVEVAERTMSASIRAGVAACPPGAVMLHLADMPEIDVADLAALVSVWRTGRATVLRAATEAGRPGQPVVFDASLRLGLMALSGDAGARAVVASQQEETLRLTGLRAVTDLDTPEAWASWEAARAGRRDGA